MREKGYLRKKEISGFGRWLKTEMRHYGVTQQQFCDATLEFAPNVGRSVGLSQPVVSSILRGDSLPDWATMYLIASAIAKLFWIHVSPDEIFSTYFYPTTSGLPKESRLGKENDGSN